MERGSYSLLRWIIDIEQLAERSERPWYLIKFNFFCSTTLLHHYFFFTFDNLISRCFLSSYVLKEKKRIVVGDGGGVVFVLFCVCLDCGRRRSEECINRSCVDVADDKSYFKNECSVDYCLEPILPSQSENLLFHVSWWTVGQRRHSALKWKIRENLIALISLGRF